MTRTTPSGIAYDRTGPSGGVPIVLVHAGIADRRMWDSLWPDLTAERNATRLDLRGFGESHRAPAGRLSPIDDVIATLDHLEIGRCHLVGSSFGAGVVTEVALTQPGRVQSLLLCPPGGSLLTELTPDLRSFFDAERAALDREDLDDAVQANIIAWVVGSGRRESDVDPAVVAAVRMMQRRAFEITASWPDLSQTELDPPASARLAEITAPVLVLVGAHDLDTTHYTARQVVDGAPRARRVEWAGVAHLPSMERPAAFHELAREWFVSHE